MITNLLTDDLAATKKLFVELLGFEVDYESDWFISMVSANGQKLAALLRTSEFVPLMFQKPAQGVMITVVVERVDLYLGKACALGLEVLEEPRDLPYGQRRLLLRDASGALVDISSPTAPVDERYT